MRHFLNDCGRLLRRSKSPKALLPTTWVLAGGAVNTYIQGKSEPCLQYLVAIAQYFDVSADYLIGNTTVVKSETPHSGVQDRIGYKQKPLSLYKIRRKSQC